MKWPYNGKTEVYVPTPHGTVIVKVPEEHGALIASAPEMLRVLKYVQSYFNLNPPPLNDTWIAQRVRNAIKIAEVNDDENGGLQSGKKPER